MSSFTSTVLFMFIIFHLIVNGLSGQSLPSEMHYSADKRILFTGGVAPEGFYHLETIREIRLDFEQPNYWALMTANYASETNIPASLTLEGHTYQNVGVRFRGNTSYMQIGNSPKKSFAVEMDFIEEDQVVGGYKNLKFNNAHQDASFMREVMYGHMARKYTPIAKANYVRVYLNGEDWGIYTNIQSVDKTFLDEWFMSNDGARFRATVEETGVPFGGWGDGTAGMNYLGQDTAEYQKYYDLKSNDVVDNPWQKMIDAFETLSRANSTNTDEVKAAIDVDKALWFLACENIFTDDDSYLMKGKMDYMLYYEPETGRTTPLEYDGNSTFVTNAATSTNWGPFKNVSNVNYPLLNKLLNIPEWRQRYLAHYRTILGESFTVENANALVDQLHSQISSHVATDTKKLYTTTQYTNSVPALKNFVSSRRNFLLSNAEVAQEAPVISSAKFYNSEQEEYAAPAENEAVTVKADINSANGISQVYLYYAAGLVGNFSKVEMLDDGLSYDEMAGDGVYGAEIPGYPGNTLMRYYVEAIADNTAKSASYLPAGAEHDIFVYTVAITSAENGVVINEVLAQNTSGQTDEAGDNEDWVELYNNNDFEVDLSGFYLSDNATNVIKWQFPEATVIAANEYLIVWADDEEDEGEFHASWKISVDGESVTLSNPQRNLVDQVIFGAQQTNKGLARVPNGTGDFVIQDATFNANNELTIATKDLKDEVNVSIYPNPVRDVLYIKHDIQSPSINGEIYNAYGKMIQIVNVADRKINVGHLLSGVYFLRVNGRIMKFIKL
ncbi:MAG: CotH kinase family protein [Saprospiraceae bacterium]|nr:CotH kinase family protein [Saprospiraceae bacterium]